MGEIADMMIDGTLDCYTGEYIGRGPGYPRTLDRSLPWERGNKGSNKFSGLSTHTKGVFHYIDKTHPTQQQKEDLLKQYAAHIDYTFSPIEPFKKLCQHIQKDWNRFKTWYQLQKIGNP